MCVDVIIVAHNAGHLLSSAVSSACDQAGAGHVWVMDAESADGSLDAVRERTPGVRIVSVPNLGFAASNNRGFALTHAPFVLLLNPDATLLPGAIERLKTTMEDEPGAAIVAPLVLDPEGGVQPGSFGRFPTLLSVLRVHAASFLGRRVGLVPTPAACSPSTATSVDWVTGAAMLVRRAAIVEAGSMDEEFFLYYEDVEWCHRMHDHGWNTLVDPRAQVIHHKGSSNVPNNVVAQAYRESFARYCDLRGLRGLKTAARVGLFLRRLAGGPS